MDSVDRRVESEESGDEEGRKQSRGMVADLSAHSLKDGEERGAEDPEGTWQGSALNAQQEAVAPVGCAQPGGRGRVSPGTYPIHSGSPAGPGGQGLGAGPPLRSSPSQLHT